MRSVNLPGTAWIAIIAFGTTWLTQYFGEYTWVPAVVAVGGGIIKAIEMYMRPVTEEEVAVGTPRGESAPAKPPNTVARWLVG